MRLFFIIFLVGLLVFFQSFGFSVFGVKPNLALAAIVAVSFFIASAWEGFLLTVLAAFILKFSPGFTPEIMVFILMGFGVAASRTYLPWWNFLSNLFLIIVGTVIFYLIFYSNFILSMIFIGELFLNIVAGILVFALLSIMRQNKLV